VKWPERELNVCKYLDSGGMRRPRCRSDASEMFKRRQAMEGKGKASMAYIRYPLP
jgi:hypothetical protein